MPEGLGLSSPLLERAWRVGHQVRPLSALRNRGGQHHLHLRRAQDRQGKNPGERVSDQAGSLRTSQRGALYPHSEDGRRDVGGMGVSGGRTNQGNIEGENIRTTVRSEKKAPHMGPFFFRCLPDLSMSKLVTPPRT